MQADQAFAAAGDRAGPASPSCAPSSITGLTRITTRGVFGRPDNLARGSDTSPKDDRTAVDHWRVSDRDAVRSSERSPRLANARFGRVPPQRFAHFALPSVGRSKRPAKHRIDPRCTSNQSGFTTSADSSMSRSTSILGPQCSWERTTAARRQRHMCFSSSSAALA